MRYLGLPVAFALGLMGCSETSGDANDAACVDYVCPCTEAGIHAAIEAGGEDPYTFDCDGPTTVLVEEQISVEQLGIDKRVVLDGLGVITLDGSETHRLFRVADGAYLALRGFTLSGGSAARGGGIYNEGWLVLENCRVQDSAAEDGGGIWTSGRLTMVESQVTDNSAVSGAGIWNSGYLHIVRSTLSENSAYSESFLDTDGFGGGGIWNNGDLSLDDSSVSDNSAEWGGGILNRGYAQLDNTSVSGNLVHREGGGIVNAGRVFSQASTVHGNAAEGAGGILNRGVLELVNSSISGNSAESSPGTEILDRSGLVTLTNTTVSGSSVESSGVMVFTNTIISGSCSLSLGVTRGYNIEGSGDTCGFDPDGTDMVGISAEELNLGPLADNGGPTMTHKPGEGGLGDGSVAIDAIPEEDCEVTTDQRGEPRPETGGTMCDVGAFEVQP